MNTQKIVKISIGVILLFLASCQSVDVSENSIAKSLSDPNPDTILKNRSANLLSKKELVKLLRQKNGAVKASQKADELFRTPFVDNSFYEKYGLPKPSMNPILGPSLRVSTWNVEKSINVREVAQSLSSEQYFIDHLKEDVLDDKEGYKEALRQRADLAHSDILLCQEMDIGHCRSGYLFAAQHLAKHLGMNFAYASQQLEIDPVYLGEDLSFGNTTIDHEACKILEGKEGSYNGVFGVAVLSRYPIKHVEVFQLENQPYDWYDGEIQKPDFLEQGRRYGAEQLFKVKPVREVKRGGRGFTRVDLHVPNVPHETISVINIHLEIKTKPENRVKQIEEILSYIHEIENPVIMAGDFNNSSRDVSSTSLSRATSRAAKSPSTFLSAGLFLANATGVNQLRAIVNGYKNFQDPLAWGVPVILPNKTKPLFKKIENFRFKDGGAFDFRGDDERSMRGVDGVLSNSNQRSRFKGFTQTFRLPKPIGPLGCERLDWIFVKSFLTDPKDKKGSYQLAPHFGETLSLVNQSVHEAFSDHHPITTILPLNEPEDL